jgi:hypothetical protein
MNGRGARERDPPGEYGNVTLDAAAVLAASAVDGG